MTTSAVPFTTSAVPFTISTLLDQLGRGITGSYCYVGGHNPTYSHPDRDEDYECRPQRLSSIAADGSIESEVAFHFAVNGKRDEDWKITISYEPTDEYTVRLTRVANEEELAEGRTAVVLAEAGEVDTLRETVASIYDKAIENFNDGIIPFD